MALQEKFPGVSWGERGPGPIKSPHRHRTSSRHPLPQGRHQVVLSVVPRAEKQCCQRFLEWLWLLWQWSNEKSPQILPLSASTAFSNSTTAQQNQLMADLIAAETSREGAVTGSTNKNHAWLRHQFTKYLGTISIGHNVFLDSFTRSQQNKIIGAFAMALREGRFSSAAHDTLALETIRNTISDIATFKENSWPNPTKDNNLQLSFVIQCQFWAYKKMPTQRNISKKPSSHATFPKLPNKIDGAPVCNLATHHSCLLPCHVFMQVPQGSAAGKTTNQNPPPPKSLILQRWTAQKLPQSLPQICQLYQHHIWNAKPGQGNPRSNSYVIKWHHICPVRAAAAIVCRFLSYPGANDSTPISAIWQYNLIEHITSRQIKNALWDAIPAIGEDTLQIAANEIGSHSIHLGAAMAMFFGGCPLFFIMMIGCWSSDAFLLYIWKQVRDFTPNVSRKMITHMFHRHIPNYTSPTVSHLDPRQSNHPDNIETQRYVGGGHGLTNQVACFCPVWQSTTSKLSERHFIYFITSKLPFTHTDSWNYKNGGSISFGANGVGQRGFWIIIRTWFQSPTALVYPLVSFTPN